MARMLRDWTNSEKINRLSTGGEVFFIRLIMKADDYGRYDARPLILKAQLFPLREEVNSENIKIWLEECRINELVVTYEVSEKPIVEIQNFDQRLRMKKSRFPSKDSSNTEDSQGYVYFIGSEIKEPIKVGFSLNPWSRVRELSTGTHIKLQVLACFKSGKKTETDFHEFLKDYKTEREWFEIPEEIIKQILSFPKEKQAKDLLISIRSSYENTRSGLNSNKEVELETEVEIEFEVFWDLYDKKVGDKEKLKRKWNKLSFSEKEEIIEYVPEYIRCQPEKRFRKNPETFLNNKSWNDELIISKSNVKRNNTNERSESVDNLEGLASKILDNYSGS